MAADPIAATIFADASVHVESGAAGWGAWIKHGSEAGLIIGGPLKEVMRSSTHAELCALANAVHVAAQRELLRGLVMLQSDSLEALSCLMQQVPGTRDAPAPQGMKVPGRRKPPMPVWMPCITFVRDLALQHQVRFVVRHVRGHQQGDGRQWVNRQCDRVAKLHRRARQREMEVACG